MKVGKRVHLVGIGGVGMSAIARVLLARGVSVTGSDVHESAGVGQLRNLGARIVIGHDPALIDGVHEVVVSTAIPPDNPEVKAARAKGIPLRHRSEVLADLFNAYRGIAVSGAHGKTTVTSMIAWTLDWAGVSPTFLIGGELPGLGGGQVGRGPWLVAEADESDGTLIRYCPEIAVLTSVEADHLENFNDSVPELLAAYRTFLGNVRPGGKIIVCHDDEEAVRLALDEISQRENVVFYGLGRGEVLSKHRAAGHRIYEAAHLVHDGLMTSFELFDQGTSRGTYTVSVPGKHNVENALACIAVCDLLHVPPDETKRALKFFRGARRRFEIVMDRDDILVIDDYAHHPSEVEATIQAAKDGWSHRLIAVFQPHRYSRTEKFMNEFSRAFDRADQVIITDIYAPPPEQAIPGVSGARLAELTQRRIGPHRVRHVPGLNQAVETVEQMLRPGDMVLTMGAGDVWKVAHRLARPEPFASA